MLKRRVVSLMAILTALCAFAPSESVPLRYNLSAGDHLIYREIFERESKGNDILTRTRAVFENHLVVVAEDSGKLAIGVQRNRRSAELLEFRRGGKDVLAQELPKFAEQLAKRPSRPTDANVYTLQGLALLPYQAVRESSSKLLYMAAELAPLPAAPVQAGSEWDAAQYGVRFRLVRFDAASSSSENCALIEGSASRAGPTIKFTFCPKAGVVNRLDVEGEYPGYRNVRFHEKVTFELLDVRRDEDPSDWLSDVDTQQAALTAYLLHGAGLPDRDDLASLLRDGMPEVQALALAAFLQQNEIPPPGLLTQMAASSDAEVRRIAARFHKDAVDPPAVCPDFRAPRFQPQKTGSTIRAMNVAPYAPYMVHVPIDYRGDAPFPLIVYLSGGDGYAFDAALSAEDILRHTGYLALYPQAQQGLWWEQQPTRTFSELLTDFLHTYNVDTNRVYITGSSNGGTASVYYGILWPQRFAAISSLMGAGLQSPAAADPLPAKNLANVPLLLVHGDRDAIIPDLSSRDTFEQMKRVHPRTPPELHILKGRGHEISLQADDGYTLPFFERFSREPLPRNISARILNTEFAGRYYWVEVSEKKGSYAEVEGKILDNNTIELRTSGVKRFKLLLRPELFTRPGAIRVVVDGKERYAGELKKDCSVFAQSADKYGDPLLAYTDEITIDLSK